MKRRPIYFHAGLRRSRLTGVCVGVVLLAGAASAGTLKQTAAGDWRFEAPLYSAEFSPAGAWRSLQIRGVEFMAPAKNGYFKQAALKPDGAGRLAGRDGSRSLEVEFKDDAFHVRMKDDALTSITATSFKLSTNVTRAVFPSAGGQTHSIPPERFLNANSGARFVAARGPAFETSPRTALSERGDGHDMGFWIQPGSGLEIGVRPLANAPAPDFLALNFTNYPRNHFFSAGPLTLPTVLENQGPREMAVDVETTLETYTPNSASRVLQTDRVSVKISAGGRVPAAAHFTPPAAPGPYEFQVRVLSAGQPVSQVRGALIYDSEHWTLPNLEPKDFDAFWQATLKEMRSRPLDAKVTEPKDRRGVSAPFQEISFNGLGTNRVRGFLAIPKLKPGEKAPAILALPGAGYGAAPLDAKAVERGFVYLALSVHDLPFGGESGRHHPKEYQQKTPYQENGLESRETYFYRHAYAHAVRVVDFLKSLPEVDTNRIMVIGASQGGSIALAVGGLDPSVALISAGVPGRVHWELLTFAFRANCSFEAPKGMTKQQMFDRTLAYCDIAYFARRIRSPTILHISLCDEINPGPYQYWAFREIPAKVDKAAIVNVWGEHGASSDPEGLADRMIRKYIGARHAGGGSPADVGDGKGTLKK